MRVCKDKIKKEEGRKKDVKIFNGIIKRRAFD
jgi:hypothetical protein